jgi:FixJ family two-component response regulator
MARDSAAVVAIVDDDEAVRTATASLVRSLGYAVQTFASGPDFLTALDGGQPACLITDVQMPSMSGVELQQKLVENGRRFPIIFMTAFPSDTIRDRVMAAGAFCFLSKPSDGDTIIRCIESALDAAASDERP